MSLPSHLHTLPSITDIPMGHYRQLSVEELALLPLNALPAHRAVRTLADAIVPTRSPEGREGSSAVQSSALVLHGHDGPGSMVVQMLAKRGVNVYAQVPGAYAPEYSLSSGVSSRAVHGLGIHGGHARAAKLVCDESDRSEQPPQKSETETRLRAWGAQHIYFGDPLQVIGRLASEGRCFDAVVDTVGGVDIWIQSQKLLLAIPDSSTVHDLSSHKQFTTLVGDDPAKPIPSPQDNLRSGFRSFRRVITVPLAHTSSDVEETVPDPASKSSTTSLPLTRKQSKRYRSVPKPKTISVKRSVGYTWVSVDADVDYEGEDVRDALGSVVGMVEEGWIRPWIGDDGQPEHRRVLPFDQAPEAFRRDSKGPVGLLQHGGTCVVKVVV